MDDLVKRLRHEAEYTFAPYETMTEAATRIEKLEKALMKIAKLKADPEFGTPPLETAQNIARAALGEKKDD